jgi:hypothetical protein
LGLLSGLGVNDRQLHNHLTPKEAAFNNYQDVEVGVVIPKLKTTSQYLHFWKYEDNKTISKQQGRKYLDISSLGSAIASCAGKNGEGKNLASLKGTGSRCSVCVFPERLPCRRNPSSTKCDKPTFSHACHANFLLKPLAFLIATPISSP